MMWAFSNLCSLSSFKFLYFCLRKRLRQSLTHTQGGSLEGSAPPCLTNKLQASCRKQHSHSSPNLKVRRHSLDPLIFQLCFSWFSTCPTQPSPPIWLSAYPSLFRDLPTCLYKITKSLYTCWNRHNYFQHQPPWSHSVSCSPPSSLLSFSSFSPSTHR